ncbi:MAG: hypothetical protein KAW17_06860 [Candidatus Eisenbacteria sp.]|nr:hypothetical protein [Candidatus Eisenbacteria bacterium]
MYRLATVAVIALGLLVGSVPAAAITYTTTINGTATLGYDADPNGIYPDPAGYGEFGLLEGDYVVTTEGFPPPEAGYFNWYVDPTLYAYGTLLGPVRDVNANGKNTRGYAVELVVNDLGIVLMIDGGIVGGASWEDLGYVYVAGKGIYMTTMITPDSFFPPDPDRLCGLYEGDYEPDGQYDFVLEITGSGGAHHFIMNLYRSATWMGMQGTGVPSRFADWLAIVLPGIPEDLLDQLRIVDLTPLIGLEAIIGDLGGPIPGNDLEMQGTFGFTILAECTGASAVDATTWTRVKALYH